MAFLDIAGHSRQETGSTPLASTFLPVSATGQGASAVELIDSESKPEVDLWQIGHDGHTTQKEVGLIREVQRSTRIAKREQIRESIRKSASREVGMERCIER
jgi:hypothetical protein